MAIINSQDLKPEAFAQAIQICQGYSTVKLAFNYNPEANHVTKNHDLVILKAPAGLISHLNQEGFSLHLESYGLIVSKY